MKLVANANLCSQTLYSLQRIYGVILPALTRFKHIRLQLYA